MMLDLGQFKKVGWIKVFFKKLSEDILGHSVDMGRPEALREHLREPVLKEAIRAI